MKTPDLFDTGDPTAVLPVTKDNDACEPAAASVDADRGRVFTVSGLLRLMQSVLEDEIGRIRIEGEIADFKQAASGHCYFSLKDDRARIACVLFAGALRGLRLAEPLDDGCRVELEAETAVYTARGQLQLIVRRVIPGGRGELLLRFEALKRKLQAEGLFDSDRKRPLPRLPRRIGIVTSPTGAAIRDMLKVLGERFPNLYLLIAPVRVQGEGAAMEIARAIERLNARGGLDLLIVGRGGGSLEDLWAFNEEVVARAVRDSRIPVVSAVGHEIDVTLCDLAADLRAPTPSAAAEMAVARKADFIREVDRAEQALDRLLDGRLRELRSRLSSVRGSRLFREPRVALAQHRQTLDNLWFRAVERLRARRETARQRFAEALGRLERPRAFDFDARRARLDALGLRCEHALAGAFDRSRQRFLSLENQMRVLSPQQVLRRGYSLAFDAGGRLVASVSSLATGDPLTVRLFDGEADTRIESVRPALHGPTE